MITFQTLQELSRGAAQADTTCPLCSSQRKPFNRTKKVLRIWNSEPGFASYNCSHCGAKGSARADSDANGKCHISEDDIAAMIAAAVKSQSAPAIVEKTYDYTDADGQLLYQVLRMKPKDFRYQRPDGNGGWLSGRGDRIVPYRWPDLVKYPDATVFVCEGEKDADRVASLEYCATNVASGGWANCAPIMTGRDVVILRDSDEAGAKRALEAVTALQAKAKTIRVVGMPDGSKDVSDWLVRNSNNKEAFEALCFGTPLWEPSSSPSPAIITGEAGDGVSIEDFWAYMVLHKYIFAPTREVWPAASVNVRVPPVMVGDKPIPAATWLDHNRQVEQMTWIPGEPMIIEGKLIAAGSFIARNGVRVFNQYRPPELQHGDPNQAGPWLDHVRKVYPDEADHIIKWLAQRVQRPQHKINHALVLGGKQGIGKDTLLEPVKRAIGPWNFDEVSPTQLMGRFNGFLKSVILRISEARDLGEFDRYKFYDHSKAYITSPPDVLKVDEKHIGAYNVANVVGVIITTNHKTDGIYLPSDDRRHFVAWSELTKDDFTPEYWSGLWSWYEAGGDGHVAAYLASLDLTDFDPKAPPPKTQAFWEIVDASRAPEDAEMQDAIDAIGNPLVLTLPMIITMADPDFVLFLKDRKNAKRIPHRLESCGYVVVRNTTTTDGRWKIGGKNQTIYGKASLPLRDRISNAIALVEGRTRY